MSVHNMLRVGNVNRQKKFREYFPFTLRDSLRTIGLLVIAVVLCVLFQKLGGLDMLVPLIFVLAVLAISICTEGYLYGVVSSFLAVFGVNYAFTYPYFAFNFSIAGYPLTFAIMLAIAIITGMLTSRVKQQERIRRETEMEKARANLLRAVSHDLRTPLTSIVGAVNVILENEELPLEERRELLGNARNDAQWLIRMVENLLSVTRVEAGDTKIDMEPEAVEEVVSEAVAKFKRQPGHVPVSVTVPQDPLFVPMNALLIEQVLLNLFDNAVAHGEKTTHIWVHISATSSYAAFCIEDDGVGISRNHERGEPGLVMQRAVTDSKRDMGIGLTVCETIIRAHNGTMTSGKSKAYGGAQFRFLLPMEGEPYAGQKQNLGC